MQISEAQPTKQQLEAQQRQSAEFHGRVRKAAAEVCPFGCGVPPIWLLKPETVPQNVPYVATIQVEYRKQTGKELSRLAAIRCYHAHPEILASAQKRDSLERRIDFAEHKLNTLKNDREKLNLEITRAKHLLKASKRELEEHNRKKRDW